MQPYLEAVKETDDAKMLHHLLEAIASIEQRMFSPIDMNSEEYQEIQNARRGIEALRRERCQQPIGH
jgi:hypothetical protein